MSTATSPLQRLGQRVAAYFRLPPEPPPAVPPRRSHVRLRLTPPLVVAAHGHVFTFQINASFVWTGEGVFREDLESLAQSSMGFARQELQRIAADVARTREPHEARELEIELTRVAAAHGRWTFTRNGTTYRCRPYIRVDLDDRVREQLLPVWERQVRLQAEHEVELRRARLAEERSVVWLEVLERLAGHPLAAAATRLTEGELADVVDTVMTEQKEAVDRLTALLDTLRNTSDLGAYERAETLDILVEQLRTRVAGRRRAE
ncbi:hypothetical protein AB0H43_16815 [Hamadaea sp. NPDC050747]|uniref:hypothetical protein n=1 Tax=Hamadaea sp. NPDC050747 TaxID=3155789 RepID=UPI0033EEF49C